MHRNRLALILGSALVVACRDNTAPSAEVRPQEPSLAAQQTKHITLQEPFAFDAQSPCTGELIHFTGLDVEQITVVGPPELLNRDSSSTSRRREVSPALELAHRGEPTLLMTSSISASIHRAAPPRKPA